MTFAEMPYQRPDLEELKTRYNAPHRPAARR